MTLATLFPPDHVFRARLSSREAVLAEIARHAALAGVPRAGTETALAAREALGSTGIGNGLAIPHARLPGLAAPLAFLLRLARPIDWQSIDARPVDLVCGLLTPAEDPERHLACLAAITRRLRDPAVAAALRAARDASGLHEALTAGA